jgi:mannosyl-oligosaccharide glucosidase
LSCSSCLLPTTLLSAGAPLTALAAQHEAAFDDRFAATFPITSTPADLDPTTLSEASKAALSNTLGSMGYFVGASRVKLPPGVKPPPPRPGTPQPPSGTDLSVVHYWREALFTATPSRSFFPRGFLWDEGFHQLLVSRWDGQISRDAISHWLDLMNSQGWIPREQILGKEARARVPSEFLVQHPSHANPPSLYLPLLAHAATAAASGGGSGEEAQRAQAFLKRAWPRLEAWYHWFNSTQAGSTPGSYM